MFYFSELKNKPVRTEDGVQIGVLTDFVILILEKPIVSKLVIKDLNKKELMVPVEFLIKINKDILIQKKYQQVDELAPNEIFLVKNLLDKQIIDLKGNKIVRVNDVVLQQDKQLNLIGVDIGFLGIIRWFGLEKVLISFMRFLGLRLRTYTLSWSDIQPLELMSGQVKLKINHEKLNRLKPEDLADYLETTNIANVERILNLVSQEQAVEVINNLNLSYQAQFFQRLKNEDAAKLIDLIDPDEAVDILLTLPKNRAEKIINFLSPKGKKKILYLLNLAKTPVGHLITTEYLTVPSSFTVEEVIKLIKKETVDFYSFFYVYVINEQNQLIGVFSLRDLLLQNLDTPVYKFMTQSLIVIHLTTPKEISLKKMLKYKLQALPVIDENKKILGIVTFDDLIEDEKIF